MSTLKHNSCLSSRSQGLRPSLLLHNSCHIAKQSGERWDSLRTPEESTWMASEYGSTLLLVLVPVLVVRVKDVVSCTVMLVVGG